MEKFNEILNDKGYRNYLDKLTELEKDRKFCKHNIEHFLDVARIGYIYVLENKLSYSKEIIYAIALLHDIGRVLEYEEGIPHHEASVKLAEEILCRTTYSTEDKNIILKAIENHRKDSDDEISQIIYKSDKLSRNCFSCSAEKECYWSKEKKNFLIKY